MSAGEGRQGSAWAAFRSLLRGFFVARSVQEPATVAVSPPMVFNEYVDAMPAPQNAVDCVTGWNHAMPPEAGAIAGATTLYNDDRIHWCLSQFGPVRNRRLLE